MMKTNTTASLFPALLRRLSTAAPVASEAAAPISFEASAYAAPKPEDMKLLRGQLHALGLGSPRGKAAAILHRYIKDGRRFGKPELISLLRELRSAKRYHSCAEIFEWMDKGAFRYNDKDHSLRIDIIYRSKGVEEAVKYFESLPAEAKNLFTYGPLHNAYCSEKLAVKAAELFEEMDKLGHLTTLAFDNMMRLALKTGELGKVPCLAEEMRRKGIPLDSYSYSLLIQSYKLLNDVESVEKVVEEYEKEGVGSDWSVYSGLVATYISAGDFQKAETALQRLEVSAKKMHGRRDPTPYHFLISFYASIGNLAAVNRIWDYLKSEFQPTTNVSYLVMLQGLNKLGQTDQLQACFEEWKEACTHFDLRLVTFLMVSHLKQNRVEEAQNLFDDAVEKSGCPYFRGREMLISHFLGKRDIKLALYHLRAAIDLRKKHDRWRPDAGNVCLFWTYFEEEKDLDGAEEFSKLLRKVKCLDSTEYMALLRTYSAAGKTAPKIREIMLKDGIEITDDHKLLLEKVCPE